MSSGESDLVKMSSSVVITGEVATVIDPKSVMAGVVVIDTAAMIEAVINH